MMAALADLATRPPAGDRDGFRLICRRTRALNNTWLNDGVTNRGRRHNPAYLHPEDLERLDLRPGDLVELRSEHGAIRAIVDADSSLLPGLISMSHGFGAISTDGTPIEDPLAVGSAVGRLTPVDGRFDSYSGMPQMSNLAVSVARVA
jgi:anaerobic selenocysteine-containing dehydrogenase